MAEHVGQQYGNYRLVRLLGQGGFADVYLGEHIYLKTPAAIKILQTRLANDDLQGFLNEARAIANLVHPNIVRVLEFGVEGSTPFLVMDYAPNGTLRQRHPKGSQVPPVTVAYYIKQVAAALQYAHDQRLVHRDIKPENMLLGRNNEVLLSDFGIAVVAQSSRYQQSGQEIGGTIAYMAPEQLQGRAIPASDQYSLGIVVYEWLCGERPFQGSFPEIASQHMITSPLPLRSKLPSLPYAIEEVVQRALAKQPQQRFMRVQAFATALEQACLGGASQPYQPASPFLSPGQSSPEFEATVPGQLAQSTYVIPPPPPAGRSSPANFWPVSAGQVTPDFSARESPGNFGGNPSGQITPDFTRMRSDQTPGNFGYLPPGQSSPGFASSPNQYSRTATPPPGDRPSEPKKGISRRAVLLGLAGVGVVAAGGITFFALSPKQNSSIVTTSTATANTGNPTAAPTTAPTDTPTTNASPGTDTSPTAVPTVQTTPGTVLYTADWSSGLNGWAGSADWKVLHGVLLNDGTNGNTTAGPTIVPPYQLEGIADYAIEAKIQVTSYQNGSSPYFGLASRGSTVSGNWQGYEVGIGYLDATNYGGSCNARIITTDFSNPLTGTPFDPAKGVHTYRFEARGNNLKLFIDGGNILETTDNRYLSGSQLGIWCYSSQLSVSSFRIIAL